MPETMLSPTTSGRRSIPKAAWRSTTPLLLVFAMTLWPLRASADDPAPDQTQQRIAQLIEQLGSNEYVVRQRAEQELVHYGFEALDAVMVARHDRDLEIASRAAYVAALINVNWSREDDPEEVRQLLRDYGQLDDLGKVTRITALAELPDDLGLQSLARIVRYDQSSAMSKEAALAILRPERLTKTPFSEPQIAARREKLEKIVQSEFLTSQRPAAAWVETYLEGLKDPAAAADQWTELLEKEKASFRAPGDETNVRHLLVLAEMQVDNLRRLHRDGDIAAVFASLVQFIPRDADSIQSLLAWLIEQEAWEAIDSVVAENDAVIASDPRILYQLAHECRRRGAYDQAERYFTRVVSLNQTDTLYWVYASWYGSEMLHDIGRDQAAAEMLDTMLSRANDPKAMSQVASLSVEINYLRSMVEYYRACDAAAQGNIAQQRDHLDKAIAQDPTDLDVLIAMYRLDDGDGAYHRQAVGRIQRHARDLKTEIEKNPGDPSAYNQYAWLVANTEGDFQEAIRLSHKSLEIRPDTGAYLDTLAHCYAAIRDYASAVKYQTRAAELEPETLLIVRKLDVFKAALEKQKRGE